jgi:hypothetical protein
VKEMKNVSFALKDHSTADILRSKTGNSTGFTQQKTSGGRYGKG